MRALDDNIAVTQQHSSYFGGLYDLFLSLTFISMG